MEIVKLSSHSMQTQMVHNKKNLEKNINPTPDIFGNSSKCKLPKDDLLKNADNENFFSKHKAVILTAAGVLATAGMFVLFKNSKALKSFFNKITSFGKTTPKVLNKATRKQEKLIISDMPKKILEKVKNGQSSFNKDVISAFVDGKEVGRMAISSGDVPGPRFFLPDYKKSLYIDYLATSPEYKGVGKELVRKAVKISDKLGYKGNVDLQACTGSLPSEFLRICGKEKCNYSATLVYRKMGFDSMSEGISNEALDSIIKIGGNGMKEVRSRLSGNIHLKDTLSCPMSLSQEAIEKFLK